MANIIYDARKLKLMEAVKELSYLVGNSDAWFNSFWSLVMENENIYEIMQLIGKKRGAIISGGNIDDEKTSKIILDDFRSGKIGKITLEVPEDIKK